jgi:hypothetical protein
MIKVMFKMLLKKIQEEKSPKSNHVVKMMGLKVGPELSNYSTEEHN